MQPDILIIGAGPAGLLAACWASQYPVSVRIIDKNASRKPTGHADGIHSRTLEILDSFGIDGVIRYGVVDNVSCYWVRASFSLVYIFVFVLTGLGPGRRKRRPSTEKKSREPTGYLFAV